MKESINYPSAGLNLDADVSALKQEEITYCLNGRLFLKGGSYFYNNLPGSELCVSIPEGNYIINGTCTNNPDEFIIFSVQTDNTNSEIGLLNTNTCSYNTIVNDECLEFNIQHQIQAEFKEDFQCGRNVYWTDNYTTRKKLNIDKVPLLIIGYEEDGCTPIYGGLDCAALQIDRDHEFPCLDISIEDTGALKTGSYFIFVQYSDVNSNGLTSWSDSYNRIDIVSRSNNINSAGDAPNKDTTKSITLQFTGLDTEFQYYNIGVIKCINGVLTAQFIITLPTSADTYTYTGIESSTTDIITIDELIVKNTIYETFKTVKNTQGYLQWGNITGKPEYNYQPYANDIYVQWVTYRVYAPNYYSKNHPYYNLMGLMRDEIYPVGIRLIRDDGSKSCVYHIPGRSLNLQADGSAFADHKDQYDNSIIGAVWDSVTENTGLVAPGNDLIGDQDADTPRWQIYNTGNTIDYTDEYNTYVLDGGDPSTYEGCYQYGNPGYWESTLTYPSNSEVWDDLICQPIRHHRMPDCSIDNIYEGIDGGAGTIGDYCYLHILGIQCSNIQIDPALFPDIIGYEILIGDRTYQKSIIAKGILYNNMEQIEPGGATDPVVPAPYYYTNWIYNDIASIFNFGQEDTVLYDNFTFYSPDTTYKKSNIGNAFECKLEKETYGKARYSGYDYASPITNVNSGTNTENGIPFLGSLVFSTGWYNNVLTPTYTSIRREILEKEYILNNVYQVTSFGNVNNLCRESSVMFTTDNTFLTCAKSDSSKYTYTIPGITEGDISSYYASLKTNIANLWGSIDSVNYISPFNMCSVGRDEVDTGCLFGGDTFISFCSFHKRVLYPQFVSNVGILNSDTFLNPNGEFGGDGSGGNDPFVMLYGNPVFYCESSINVNYRYSGLTVKETFYPNLRDFTYQLYQFESPTYMWPDIDNYYYYNQDYSKLNVNSICTQNAGYNPDDCTTHYYSRAIYSEKDQSEALSDNWLVYKPNNFYDFNKSKGELWDIKNLLGDRILYRFTNGIFLRQLNQQLETTNSTNVEIGSGSLYSPEPIELFNIDAGNIGTRSQWAFNSTQFGSFMIDDQRSSIYQFKESFNDITNIKLKSWFNTNLRLKLLNDYPDFPLYDNPANPDGIGFISTYDTQNKLWILTKRDYQVYDQDNKPLMEEDGRFYFLELIDDVETKVYVHLNDSDVFVNKSFSISFCTDLELWNSWHSFLPLVYLQSSNNFYAANDNEVHSFNSSTYFNKYFGVEFPYILEIPAKAKDLVSKLNTVFWKSYCRIPGDSDFEYEQKYITFDSGFVYSSTQNTGSLVFNVKDPNSPAQTIQFPYVSGTDTNVLVSTEDGIWSLNYLFDKTLNSANPVPSLTNSWSNSDYIAQYPIDKVIDQTLIKPDKNWYELKPLKGQWNKARLFFNRSDLSLQTTFVIQQQDESIRN